MVVFLHGQEKLIHTCHPQVFKIIQCGFCTLIKPIESRLDIPWIPLKMYDQREDRQWTGLLTCRRNCRRNLVCVYYYCYFFSNSVSHLHIHRWNLSSSNRTGFCWWPLGSSTALLKITPTVIVKAQILIGMYYISKPQPRREYWAYFLWLKLPSGQRGNSHTGNRIQRFRGLAGFLVLSVPLQWPDCNDRCSETVRRGINKNRWLVSPALCCWTIIKSSRLLVKFNRWNFTVSSNHSGFSYYVAVHLLLTPISQTSTEAGEVDVVLHVDAFLLLNHAYHIPLWLTLSPSNNRTGTYFKLTLTTHKKKIEQVGEGAWNEQTSRPKNRKGGN